jgi:ATP-GRASP peptide maturase of grasp-with-spasm system
MILIISDSKDLSTTHVIEWLNNMGKKWIRINNEDIIQVNFIGKDIVFSVDDFEFRLSEIKSVWHRRVFLNFTIDALNVKEFDQFLHTEMQDIKGYVYFQLTKLRHLDTVRNAFVNKLIVNDIAQSLGLIVPESYLFNKKEDLSKLIQNSVADFITKSISGNPSVNFDNTSIINYTTKVSIEDVKSETFAPSLIQNYIEKKYELRIFYFKGDFYSMAILSQRDEQTKMDFRVYNDVKPNRRSPFKLPKEIELKLNDLMLKLGYDTGSIDMIVTPEHEYVFLEVNAVGQFGMTSFPCNYNLEKKIAEYL